MADQPQGQSGIVSPQNPTGAIFPIGNNGTQPTPAQSGYGNPTGNGTYGPTVSAPYGYSTVNGVVTPNRAPMSTNPPIGTTTRYNTDGTVSPSYPTATGVASDAYASAAAAAAKTPQQIQSDIMQLYAQEIAGIKAQYAAMRTQQQGVNANNEGQVRAAAAASGALGSAAGASDMGTAADTSAKALANIDAEELAAEGAVFDKSATSALGQYQTNQTNLQNEAKTFSDQLTATANNAINTIKSLAVNTPLASLDQATYQSLLSQSGLSTPQEFEQLWNAVAAAARVPNTTVSGSATTGYYALQIDPTTGAIKNVQQVVAPATPKPVSLNPGQKLVDPKTGQTIAQGNAKLQVVPFMSTVVSTGGSGGGTGVGSAADKATAGNVSAGGAQVKSSSGSIYGLTAGQSSLLTQAGVPKELWGDIAGIVTGSQPPPSTASGSSANSKYMLAVKNGLQALGYNLSQATLDWQAMTTRLKTLNGAQQVRLSQAVNFAYDSLDIIQTLTDAWQGGGLPALNSAELAAASSGVSNQTLKTPVTVSVTDPTTGQPTTVTIKDTQTLATLLKAQINDLVSELGTVYKGGNTSTDESLSLAAGNLSANWSQQTLDQAINLARTNLQIRKNSISNSAMIPGNQYNPSTGQPTATQSSSLTPDQLTAIKSDPTKYGGNPGDTLVTDPTTGQPVWATPDEMQSGQYTPL